IQVALRRYQSHSTCMALAHKRATTIALDPGMDELLDQAAADRGVSRSEFIRQHLALVLEQYRRHPRPKAAGIIRHRLAENGDEAELFAHRHR
ncbi:MAG TPA: ribbon-helix-helix protein, CopG family, partial [Anaeromyxobacteraceae bacterium]|nr:ribbon-helix-helix protein, CopG family [Anaeromyxobacteraceae bacterium]